MIRYQFFPRSVGISDEVMMIVNCFITIQDQVDSSNSNLPSDSVLEILRPHLEGIGMKVESGKKQREKIKVPVLFGLDNRIDKFFDADGLSHDGRIVLEVEQAGP